VPITVPGSGSASYTWTVGAPDSCDEVASSYDVFYHRPGFTPLHEHLALTIEGSCSTLSGNLSDADGNPVEGGEVTLCPAESDTGVCLIGDGDSTGKYNIPRIPPGTYRTTARPGPNADPDLFGIELLHKFESGSPIKVLQNFVFRKPVPIPDDVSISSLFTGLNGVPVLFWRDEITIEKAFPIAACTGTYEVTQGDAVLRSGEMLGGPPGPSYFATFAPLFPKQGIARVTIRLDCLTGPHVESFDVYIDPSGTVQDTLGDPIADATVTLLRSDSAGGPFAAVPDGSTVMSPTNRDNPDLTGAAGHFGWDVVSGYYKVRAEKSGCHAPADPARPFVETGVLTIPPPVTDLVLELECPADTEAPALTLPDYFEEEATGPAGAVVTYVATATDDVDPAPTLTCDPVSGSTFPLGETTVSCTATDASDNSSEGSFVVSVVDTTAPTVSCGPGVNPAGKPNPDASAGFRQLNTSDSVGVVSLVLTDGAFTSGDFASGDYVKLTQAGGSSGSDSRPGPGVLAAQVKTGGDPWVVAADEAGNVSTASCGDLPPLGG
jgi:hypothetical protein